MSKENPQYSWSKNTDAQQPAQKEPPSIEQIKAQQAAEKEPPSREEIQAKINNAKQN